MNERPVGDRAPDVTPDLKKIEWWMGQTRAISADLLRLSGYVQDYANREAVIVENGVLKLSKVSDLKQGSELRFWPPKEKKDDTEFHIFMKFYEHMKRTLDSYDNRITECFKAGKVEKVRYLMMEKELCQRPHPGWDSIFNALLDRFTLKAAEVMLSEMRQMPNSRLFYLFDKERELNEQ